MSLTVVARKGILGRQVRRDQLEWFQQTLGLVLRSGGIGGLYGNSGVREQGEGVVACRLNFLLKKEN